MHCAPVDDGPEQLIRAPGRVNLGDMTSHWGMNVRSLASPVAWRETPKVLPLTPLYWPLTALGALFLVAVFLPKSQGWDLMAYWHVDLADPYGATTSINAQAAFRYAPPVALLFAPLALLPWPVLVVGWMAAQLAVLYAIAGRWALALVLFPPVWSDLNYGNINIFIAGAVAFGLSRPGLWAFPLLTKVTPGVGVLWFAVRREWRKTALALGTTAAIVGVSLLVQGPEVWREWFALLASSAAEATPYLALPVPLLPRLAAAVVLLAWGGLTDRRWTIPVAVTLAMPTLWPIALTPLIALLRLGRPEPEAERVAVA